MTDQKSDLGPDLTQSLLNTSEPLLSAWEVIYRNKGNPIVAWIAYRYCREMSRSVPRWVVEYLDQVADNIKGLCDSPPRDVDAAVSLAFGFKSNRGRVKGSLFSDHHSVVLGNTLSKEVCDRVKRGEQVTWAIKDVSRDFSVSKTKIERMLRSHEGSSPFSIKEAKGHKRRVLRKSSDSRNK